MDPDRQTLLSRVPLLVSLAAAPILVLLARMPTSEERSSCGMSQPWNESLTAQVLILVAVLVAYRSFRRAWKLRFAELT